MSRIVLLDPAARKRAIRLVQEHRNSRQARYRRYRDGEGGGEAVPCPRCGSTRQVVRVFPSAHGEARPKACPDCGRSGLMEMVVARVRRSLREHGAADEILLAMAAIYINGLKARSGETVEPIVKLRSEE